MVLKLKNGYSYNWLELAGRRDRQRNIAKQVTFGKRTVKEALEAKDEKAEES